MQSFTLTWMLTLCIIHSSSRVFAAPVSTEYQHWVTRQAIIDIVITPPSRARWDIKDEFLTSLSKEERAVGRYLDYLRSADLATDIMTRSVDQSLPNILQSDLFQVLRKLPKGGNMHAHENHLLSRRLLLDLIWERPEFDHLYILAEDHPSRALHMDLFLEPPLDDPWIQVKSHPLYTKEYLVRRLNHVNILNGSEASKRPGDFDTVRRWAYTGSLWGAFTKVLANVNIKAKYMEALLRTSLEDGVQYLETKKSFNEKERIYQLDPDPKYKESFGKRYLETVAGTQEIPLVNMVIETVRDSGRSPGSDMKLIGMKRLVQSVRHLSRELVYEDVQRAIQLHKMYPGMIAGFDLAGEEDTGPSSLHHIDSLLLAAEYSKETNNSFRLICHAGETSYSGDIRSRLSEDTETFSGINVVDLLALNASRLGHGLSIVKDPSLMRLVKERGIALEICPVCNQMLGYVPDLRNHPAITYHRAGIPIVLGSDAHGVLGSEYFTVDWYLAYMAWDMDIGDLKRLGYNSLYYSSLSDGEKVEALQSWKSEWHKFIDTFYRAICTDDQSLSMGGATTPSFGPTLEILKITPERLPREALDDVISHVDIHVYGQDFSLMICSDVFCKTGDGAKVVMEYETLQHIVCRLSVADVRNSLRNDDGISYFDVNLFTDNTTSEAEVLSFRQQIFVL